MSDDLIVCDLAIGLGVSFIKTNNFPTKKEPINIDCLDYGKINGSYINVKDVSDIDHCFVNKKTTKTNEIINISNKIAYFISGLGIKIAMLFTNSPMIIFFAGRLFNTICSFLIILYALKIVPKHKRIILSN